MSNNILQIAILTNLLLLTSVIFVEIIDLETENNITIYLDKKEYQEFAKDTLQNIELFKDKV
jgi:hypothetical protein